MRWPHEATRTWKVLVVVAFIIRPFFLRLQVEGAEHLPRSGGCIAACNHTLGPDYVILGYASPRQIYYMAKVEIFKIHPWLSALVRGAGAFPVRRGERDGDAIEQAVRMIDAGYVVGMFPEGTRSRTGGLQRGRTGVARIALAANAPIVPVVVINTEPVLRDVFKLRRRPLVIVRFGPALDLTSADVATPQQLTTRIMLALAELLPPERHGHYADRAMPPLEDEVAGAAPPAVL